MKASEMGHAVNKTYFQHVPEAVRPKTLISRQADDIKEFVDEVGGRAVRRPVAPCDRWRSATRCGKWPNW